MPKYICEISASGSFYYKEICNDARSHEREVLTAFCYDQKLRYFDAVWSLSEPLLRTNHPPTRGTRGATGSRAEDCKGDGADVTYWGYDEHMQL